MDLSLSQHASRRRCLSPFFCLTAYVTSIPRASFTPPSAPSIAEPRPLVLGPFAVGWAPPTKNILRLPKQSVGIAHPTRLHERGIRLAMRTQGGQIHLPETTIPGSREALPTKIQSAKQPADYTSRPKNGQRRENTTNRGGATTARLRFVAPICKTPGFLPRYTRCVILRIPRWKRVSGAGSWFAPDLRAIKLPSRLDFDVFRHWGVNDVADVYSSELSPFLVGDHLFSGNLFG